MSIFAAIDIGSNAMRLAIGGFDGDGNLTLLATRRAPVRLGSDVFRHGRISAARMEEGVAAFLDFEDTIRQHNIDVVRAVATSALRDAENSGVFIDRVRRATGIVIDVITGDEEAQLIYGAVSRSVPLSTGTTLLFDIGGGSLEITLLKQGNVLLSESLNMGTVRILEMVRGRKNSEAILLRLLQQYSRRIRARLSRRQKSLRISRLVGTGGNVDTLGDLRRRVLKKKDSTFIRKEELLQVIGVLKKMTVRERIEKLGLRPDRADVIMPALALIQGIIQESRQNKLLIPRTGLREGVLYDLFAQWSSNKTDIPLQRFLPEVRSQAFELGRRYGFDETHARHAATLALQVFDQTRSGHRLGTEQRALLEIAAILHDIGYFVNSAEHQKHSAYIIRCSNFVGLTERQRELVALIARYHRDDPPSPKDGDFGGLSKADRKTVATLAAVLRLVEELDREHLQRVSRVAISQRGGAYIISLPSRSKLLVERVGVEATKRPLEKSLGRPIRLR
jgi:exopolyphosphatase / guanosine-5'-triphosphate,3'-diphosphate pyrophosphatase